MQRRVFVAVGVATLCLLTSCQSRPPIQAQAGDAAARLTLDQATDDLDYFFKTVEKVHPNHLANLSKKEYRQLKDRSRAAVERANEEAGYVSRRVLALAVAEAAATLGDGHTSSRLTAELLDPCDASACMPPFRMGWQAGCIVVSETREDLRQIQGAQLLGINDRPPAETLEPIVARISGERPESQIVDFLREQDLYWALIRPVEGDRMTLAVRQTTGETRTLTVDLIPPDRYRKDVPPGPSRPSLGNYSFFQDDRTCYWQYNSCDATPQGLAFIEAVFQAARDHHAANLILDLRFNSGGSHQAVRTIIDHLTSRPYRLYSRIGARISEHLLRDTPQWYLRPFKGSYLSFSKRARRPRRVENPFEGSVYVLTSPSTFSAAADLAAVLKDYGLATLIGEETGGLRQSFGEARGDRLPNSGLGFSVSCKVFCAPVPRPDDAKRGTVPDIVLTEERLRPFIEYGDPEVVYVLDLIEKRDAHRRRE